MNEVEEGESEKPVPRREILKKIIYSAGVGRGAELVSDYYLLRMQQEDALANRPPRVTNMQRSLVDVGVNLAAMTVAGKVLTAEERRERNRDEPSSKGR